jgi:hypothetical protein
MQGVAHGAFCLRENPYCRLPLCDDSIDAVASCNAFLFCLTCCHEDNLFPRFLLLSANICVIVASTAKTP